MEREGRSREVEAESRHQLIRLNTMLMQQAHMDMVLRVVTEQSVGVFDGLVNRLDGDLVNPYRVRL